MLPASIALSIRCPQCPALEGERCRTRYGRPMLRTHVLRRPAFICEACERPTGKRNWTRFCQDCADGRQDAQNRASTARKSRAAILAHRAVAAAIKAGTLVRPKRCAECGERRYVVAHHLSYDAAWRLLVRWACKRCHGRGHAAERAPKRKAA